MSLTLPSCKISRKTPKVCMFCYKSCRKLLPEEDFVASKVVSDFSKSLERFLGKNGKALSLVDYSDLLDCCNDCSEILSVFRELYHELKILELNLEWKLSTLVTIMKLAEKVPSRTLELKSLFEDSQDIIVGTERGVGGNPLSRLQTFKALRADLVRMCSRKKSKSFPRVSMERLKVSTEPVASTNFKAENENHDTLQVFLPLTHKLEMFLGWIMSFGALLLLASIPTRLIDCEETCSWSNSSISIAEEEEVAKSPVASSLEVSFQHKIDKSIVEDVYDVIDVQIEDTMPTINSIFIERVEESSGGRAEEFFVTHLYSQRDNDNSGDLVSEFSLSSPNPNVDLPSNEGDEVMLTDERQTVVNPHENPELIKEPLSSSAMATSIAIAEYDSSRPRSSLLRNNNNSGGQNSTVAPSIRSQKGHSRKKKYNCTTCSVSFSSYQTLRQHKTTKRHQHKFKILIRNQQDIKREQIPPTDEDAMKKCDHTVTTHRHNNCVSTSINERRISMGEKPEQNLGVGRTKLKCRLDGCRYETRVKTNFKSHQKLHTPGEYKCKFCDVIEASVIRLSIHERNLHLSLAGRPKFVSGMEIFYCPRCTYETKTFAAYTRHFAEAHINGFTFSREKNEDYLPCKICKLKFAAKRMKKHFQNCHDLRGVMIMKRPANVWRCKVNSCHAYFRTRYQLRYHRKKFHLHCPTETVPDIGDIGNHEGHSQEGEEQQEGVVPETSQMKSIDVDSIEYPLVKARRNILPAEKEEESPVPLRRYNLREKRKHTNYVEDNALDGVEKGGMSSDGNSDYHVDMYEESSTPNSSDNDDINISRLVSDGSSSSSTSSESDDDGEGARSKGHSPRHSHHCCNLDNCTYEAAHAELLQEHQKLHTAGEYKCNFCDVVEVNVIKLSRHEINLHSASALKKEGRFSDYLQKEHFCCSRCPYQTQMLSFYEWHFAEVHIGGFKRPKLKRNYRKCKICNLKVAEHQKDAHYKSFHDMGEEDIKILKCSEERCSAYFKTEDQIQQHRKKIHGIVLRNPAEQVACRICKLNITVLKQDEHFERYHDTTGMEENQIRKCDLEDCPAYFRTDSLLQSHIRRIHTNLDDPEEILEPETGPVSYKCKMCDETFPFFFHSESIKEHFTGPPHLMQHL